MWTRRRMETRRRFETWLSVSQDVEDLYGDEEVVDDYVDTTDSPEEFWETEGGGNLNEAPGLGIHLKDMKRRSVQLRSVPWRFGTFHDSTEEGRDEEAGSKVSSKVLAMILYRRPLYWTWIRLEWGTPRRWRLLITRAASKTSTRTRESCWRQRRSLIQSQKWSSPPKFSRHYVD